MEKGKNSRERSPDVPWDFMKPQGVGLVKVQKSFKDGQTWDQSNAFIYLGQTHTKNTINTKTKMVSSY